MGRLDDGSLQSWSGVEIGEKIGKSEPSVTDRHTQTNRRMNTHITL